MNNSYVIRVATASPFISLKPILNIYIVLESYAITNLVSQKLQFMTNWKSIKSYTTHELIHSYSCPPR